MEQYAATEHYIPFQAKREDGTVVDLNKGTMPGVFFYYEMSDLCAFYDEKAHTMGHFLTHLCAIIGGVFTVLGLVDKAVYRLSDALKTRSSGGGGGTLLVHRASSS